MPINGDNLGTDIYDAAKKDVSDNGIPNSDPRHYAWWQAISNVIAGHVNPLLVILPILENWTNVSVFVNNWVNYDIGIHESVGFYKDPYNRVFLRGAVKDGIADGIFNLPNGYRPTKEERFAISGNGLFGEIRIEPTGLVSKTIGLNTRLHLTGISFRI